MPRDATLPFLVRRSSDVITRMSVTSTTETVYGLFRLEEQRVVVQWRLHRSTDQVGMQVRTDAEVGEVREIAIPLAAVGGALLRRPWWAFGRRLTLVLTANDLQAMDALTGAAGLQLAHPGQLEVRIRPSDYDLAREFVADLALAIGEHELRLASGSQTTPDLLAP
jgi:hypothetical protein